MILTNSNINSIDIDNFILELIKNNKNEEILIITTTNRRARRLKKWMIEQTPGQKVSAVNIYTLKTISENLLLLNQPFHSLSEASAGVFIEQSISRINLLYFNKYKGNVPFGTIEELRNVISEFKEHGITPNLLREEATGLGRAESKKLTDIANIYQEYLQITLPIKAYELGDVYRELTNLPQEQFKSIFVTLLPAVKFVFILGFDEFTNLELKLLQLFTTVNHLKIFIEIDYYKYNQALFNHLNDCFNNLTNSGFYEVKDNFPLQPKAFQLTVKKHLFKNTHIKKNNNFYRQLNVIEAENRIEEIEKIAGEVKRLILSEKVKPSNICVAFNVIGNYSHYVRDIFDSFGIPFNLTDRLTLDRTLPITGLINLLAILENNFYYKNILRAFHNSFISVKGVDINNLNMILHRLNILVGLKNWKEKINLELKKTKDENTPEIKKDSLLNALESIKNIERLLQPFAHPMPIDEFLHQLKILTKKINLATNLFKGNDVYQEINIKSVTTFFETIEEIFRLINKAEGKNKLHNLHFYLSKLRTAARFSRFNVKERPDYGVLITSVNEIRGLKFDYLFLGGMIDGDFPTKYKPEIFKPDKFSSNERKHLLEERYLFYQALNSWKKGLYFSYPLRESKKDLSPSLFLIDFKKLFKVSEYPNKELNRFIFSQEKYYESFEEGKNIPLNGNEIERIMNLISTDKLRLAELNTPDNSPALLFEKDSEENSFYKKELSRLKNNVYSVSQLETYANCPFKYFIERILKIQQIKEPSEEIEPLEFGNLLHKILFRFYTKIKNQKIKLAGCSPETFEFAEKLLFDIAEEEAASTPLIDERNFFEREKIFGINGNRKNSILYKFLESERGDDSDFEPYFFETKFGFENSNKKETFKIGDVKLRGKIDRIEINQKENKINVVDYKTGSNIPNAREIKNGLSLQLPVYLFAATEKTSAKPNKMFIYSLQYSNDKFGKKLLSVASSAKNNNLENLNMELFKNLEKNITNYVKDISEGKFPLSKLPNRKTKICRYCYFKSVCRAEEF